MLLLFSLNSPSSSFRDNRMLQLLWLLFVLLVTVTSYPKSALVIIDVQDCFLAGGNLAVSDSDQVIPVINNIRRKYEQKFSLVILSQDWHCHDHVSFVSSHPGNSVYQVVNLTYNKAGISLFVFVFVCFYEYLIIMLTKATINFCCCYDNYHSCCYNKHNDNNNNNNYYYY